MKLRLLIMMALSLSVSMGMRAQDYDDIYYDSSQEAKTVQQKKEEVSKPAHTPAPAKTDVVADYFSDEQTAGWEGNIVDMRDVDEYNRHDDTYAMHVADTVLVDSADVASAADAFQYTERIRRFYNPEVIDSCADTEAVNLYVYTRPDVNIIVGTPTTTYVSPWGATMAYGSWSWGLSVYDPWLDPWIDPWYYRPYWYYSSWYRPYWGWGWSAPYYAYHSYYPGWWHSAPSYRHYSDAGRRLYANNGTHRRYATATNGQRGLTAQHRQAVTGRGNSTLRRQQANNTDRLNRNAMGNNTVDRYRSRVNRIDASIADVNRSAVTNTNRATINGSAVAGRNTINRTTATSSIRNGAGISATTTTRRANQLNRQTTVNRTTTATPSYGAERNQGYRSTRSTSSYYRNNRSNASTYRNSATSNYNQYRNSSTSTYRRSTPASSYDRSSGSSFRSSSRSSGYSRGSSGAVRSGGGGRGGRR